MNVLTKEDRNMSIDQLRNFYHRATCEQLLVVDCDVPSIADVSSPLSIAISWGIVDLLGVQLADKRVTDHDADFLFTKSTQVFLQDSFALLRGIRPGEWQFSTEGTLQFEQHEHVVELQRLFREKPDLKAALGESYLLLAPDILVGRQPVADNEINQITAVVGDADSVCRLSPLRAANHPNPCWILHASISCKWTMRSDRAQNIRTEGLNLIRNRKGHTPHIAAVTAEPLPSRLASLALGTGDLDCVYHFALPELQIAVAEKGSSGDKELLLAMIDGRRLRRHKRFTVGPGNLIREFFHDQPSVQSSLGGEQDGNKCELGRHPRRRGRDDEPLRAVRHHQPARRRDARGRVAG
jgi:hypothetical protein